MKLYIKQKTFTFVDRFSIKNEVGEDVYWVEGEVFSFGKRLHVYDMSGKEIVFIEQQLLKFMPRYNIYINGACVAELRKELSFFLPKYFISGPDWNVSGEFCGHDYEITQSDQRIAVISKEWMTWGDRYELNIVNQQDEILALAVVLTIDCVLANASS